MKQNTIVRLAACAAVAVAAGAVLPLSAAELTHRWSFNGDWSDSAGGVDAVKCGEVLVKMLYNERETKVRGLVPLAGPYYRWQDLREHIFRAIKRIGDSK